MRVVHFWEAVDHLFYCGAEQAIVRHHAFMATGFITNGNRHHKIIKFNAKNDETWVINTAHQLSKNIYITNRNNNNILDYCVPGTAFA